MLLAVLGTTSRHRRQKNEGPQLSAALPISTAAIRRPVCRCVAARLMSACVAHFGHGAMSDLSPLCAAKRTSADALRLGFGRFACGDGIGMPFADATALHPLPQPRTRPIAPLLVIVIEGRSDITERVLLKG
jgi:hypothetical protein